MTSFEKLIDPISVEQFFAEYLERRPLHLGGRPFLYGDLFSWQEMEDIAFRGARDIAAQNLRVFRIASPAGASGGQLDEIATPPPGGGDLSDWMRARYRDGYSFYFKRVDAASARLAQLVQDLRLLFNGEASAAAYLAPATASGFHTQCDPQDVLVLQIHGERRWLLHGQWDKLPARHRAARHPTATPGQEILLKPGDFLYLPRGFAYQPSTGDTPSLHLSVHLHPYRWMDVVKELCELAADTGLELRRRVPTGPSGTLADQAGLGRGFAGAHDCLRRESLLREILLSHRRKLLESCGAAGGIFSEPARVAVDSATRVRRAGECMATIDGERSWITCAGCTIAAPLVAHEAFEYIAAAPGAFEIGSLPASLDEPAKQLLASRLIREGILRLERAAP